MKNQIEIGILGSRRYVGAELRKRLDNHPALLPTELNSRGETFVAGVPEVVIFSLPDKQSSSYLEQIKAQGAEPVIVDVSSDHRSDPGWTYGLPEHFRSSLEGAKRISNPGCYATAMQLGIRPAFGIVDYESIVASGTSGYSGAGRAPSRKNDPMVLVDNLVVPYSTIGHPHEEEVAMHLVIEKDDLQFMPRVGNLHSGIILELRMRAKHGGVSAKKLYEHYKEYYYDERLITVTEGMPDLSSVVNTDKCIIGGFQASGRELAIIVMLDNLGKGAAGQAIQNVNLALGMPETTGLILDNSEKNKNNTFSGKEVLQLPARQLMEYADRISLTLASKPKTMLQWSPQQIFESMVDGRAAIITDLQNNLLGFAQSWEYPHNLFEHIEGEEGKKVLEVGSWLSFAPGIGQKVFVEAVRAGRAYDPNALIIGIVEQNNIPAQKAVEKVNGVKVGQKFSPDLKDEFETPALMNLYDLSSV